MEDEIGADLWITLGAQKASGARPRDYLKSWTQCFFYFKCDKCWCPVQLLSPFFYGFNTFETSLMAFYLKYRRLDLIVQKHLEFVSNQRLNHQIICINEPFQHKMVESA